MEQQKTVSSQILSEIATKVQYVGRYISLKEVITRKFWTFELGTQEGIKFAIWIFEDFQQR